MLELYRAADLIMWAESIKQIETTLGAASLEPGNQYDAELLQLLATGLRGLAAVAEKLHLGTIVERAHKAASGIEASELSAEIALHETKELRATLRTELNNHTLIFVEPHDKRYYVERLLKPEAASRFPASDEELSEAGKCFALGRYTASVLHAMRALESSLESLAKAVGLPKSADAWGRKLGRIEKAIADYAASGKTAHRRRRAQFFSEAAVGFRYFKDAWRNYAMHARQNYDREAAERILRNVVDFTEHLSKELRQR